MTVYRYKALSTLGAVQSGKIEATSRASALELLHKRGLFPLDVVSDAEHGDGNSLLAALRSRHLSLLNRDRIGLRELSSLTYSLAALLRADLTIDRALTIAASLEKHPPSRQFFIDLGGMVRTGMTFSQALADSRVTLPPYFLSMVQAGEVGGTLSQTLIRVAELLRKQLELRERIQSALIYPILLAIMVVFTLVILVAFVLPRFQLLFSESEAPLPLSTRVVLAIGAFTGHYWWALLAMLVLGIIALSSLVRSSAGKEYLDRWMLSTRWSFGLPAAINTARMLRTLATLLQNAIPLASALRIAQGTLANTHLRRALAGVAQKVKAGEGFTTALAAAEVFPNQAVQLARVGEETGRLAELLLEAARILDDDSARNLERLLTLLVPVLTIGMGLIVAALIGSVLIGLLSINDLAF